MSDAIDRALSENHALIAAILEHHSSGRHVPAVALLERLQLNLEFIAALSEHGVPAAGPPPPPHDLNVRPAATAPQRIAPALPVPLVSQPLGTMYWTTEEHARFEQAMTLYGNARDGKPNFKAIASFVGTRTPVQVRSHLQKVQKKARKDAEENQSHLNQQPENVMSQAGDLPMGSQPETATPSATLSAANKTQGTS